MPTDDREQQFERALTRHMRDASPDSHCPDAETLSAYHERTLSLDEMSFWKEHIVGCARCQETLALVEQSENIHAEQWQQHDVPVATLEHSAPSAPAAPRRAMGAPAAQQKPTSEAAAGVAPTMLRKAQARHWRWAAPLGALAAAAIVWVGVRELQTRHTGESQQNVLTARNEQTDSRLSSPSSAELQKDLKREDLETKKSPVPQPSLALDETLRKEETAHANAPKVLRAPAEGSGGGAMGGVAGGVPAAADQSALPMKGRNYTQLEAPISAKPKVAGALNERDAENAPAPAPPAARARVAPKPSAAASGPMLNQNQYQNQNANQTQNQQAPHATTQSVEVVGQANETVTVEANAVSVQTDQADKLAPESSRLSGLTANYMKMLPADQHQFASPSQKYAWRVGEVGKIERSVNRGRSWKPQDSGVSTDLTAGFAVSDRVCWVVGKKGTILRTTNSGKHWKQIQSPVTDDLGGVQGKDAANAAIWVTENRARLETSDGGATWTRATSQ